MTENEERPTEKIGTRITSIDDLKPRVLYRLHVHEYIPGVARQILRVEMFRVPESESGVVSHEGLVPVIKVGEDGETESSYRLADLGITIERSAKEKSPLSPNTMAWSNWVEQVPVAKSAPKKP